MAENKHTAYDLAQMQSLPLQAKINMSKTRIRGWYDHWDGDVYVSISGGKDSQVLAHLVKSMYPDVPLVFVNTGLEFDSVRKKGIELADVVLRPEMDFVNVITKYGYPVISKEVAKRVKEYRNAILKNNLENCTAYKEFNGLRAGANGYEKSSYNKVKWAFITDAPFKISHMCCIVNKEGVARKFEKENNLHPFLGTMVVESRARRKTWHQNGCNAFDSTEPKSTPIAFWTEQDIFQYIKKYNVEIAEIYGEVVYRDDDGMLYDEPLFNDSMKLETTGAKRTGCVFCLFGITQEPERLLRLKEAEPLKYDYVMRGGKFDEQGMWIPHNGLGYKFVIDWLNENGNLNIKY